MTDTKVLLTQKPYIQNGMYHIPTTEGTPSNDFLQGPWWQANAEDDDSSSIVEYTVIWKTEDENEPEDWSKPTFIIARGDISIDITKQSQVLENEFLTF